MPVPRRAGWALNLLLAACIGPQAAAKTPLTVTDAIETVRLMVDPDEVSAVNPDGAVSISPDGRTYIARLVSGSTVENGVWVTLISGKLDSLTGASQPKTVLRLFTTGLGDGPGDTGAHTDTAYANPITWSDNEHVLFLSSAKRGIRQLVRVDVTKSTLEYLTDHATPIVKFALSAHGALLYTATPPRSDRSDLNLTNGFVVPDGLDAYALFTHDLSGANVFDRIMNTEWFYRRAGSAHEEKIRVADREMDMDRKPQIFFSPDGKLALIGTSAQELDSHWSKYENERMRSMVKEAIESPRLTARRHLHQYFILDLEHGISRTLWNVANPFSSFRRVAWSPNGKRVLVAPTFLPVDDADSRGRNGSAIAAVDVASGEYRCLPANSNFTKIESMRWDGNNRAQIVIEAEGRTKHLRFAESQHRWRLIDEDPALARRPPGRLRIEVREDLNTPPRLFAVDLSTGRERMILDLNPAFTKAFALGRVEKIEGAIDSEHKWGALLFYPVGYEPGRRYPLVIQSDYGRNGKMGASFTIYGDQNAGLGPPLFAPYPGQVLANTGIAVAHLDVEVKNAAEEANVRRRGFESVANQLIASGLASRDNIGLVGFSRNGYYVEYTLTHSDFPFAAAIAADNWDPSYFAQTLDGYSRAAAQYGGHSAFGEGLKVWLREAPGFNVEKVRTPLLKIGQTGGLYDVLGGWEIFSRLRMLKKPVEFYLIPDSGIHGAHNIQNPLQVSSVQQYCVDWFDFWLNERRIPWDGKREQYDRWSKLRDQVAR